MDGVNQSIRSLLSRYWPVLGSFYLVYLALQPPPSRYVGVGGLVIVTPLLFGWAVGNLFGVGLWAPVSDTDEADSGAPKADIEAAEADPEAAADAPASTEETPSTDGDRPDTDEDAPDAGATD